MLGTKLHAGMYCAGLRHADGDTQDVFASHLLSAYDQRLPWHFELLLAHIPDNEHLGMYM